MKLREIIEVIVDIYIICNKERKLNLRFESIFRKEKRNWRIFIFL